MNFFRTVFSDDPDPPISEPEVLEKSPQNEDSDANSSSDEQEPNPNPLGGWSFGGLIKTISTKSESVLETYRRDLKEFGSGLKKEIEVAQGSLGTVGHVIDEFGNSVLQGTAEIISQGKEAILAIDQESDSSDNNVSSNANSTGRQSFNSKRYSRFDAQVRAIQGDINTYCEEPEDLADYDKWKSGFMLKEKDLEIESLLGDNGNIDSLYERVVPNHIDHETFWCRYFYKVHKLKQAEDMMAKIVRRAISTEEEDLSWDVDDSGSDDGNGEAKGRKSVPESDDVVGSSEVDKKESKAVLKEEESKVASSVTAVETEENSDLEKTSIDDGHPKLSSIGSSEKTAKEKEKIEEEPLLGKTVTLDNVKGENNSEVNSAGKGSVESSSGSAYNEKLNSEESSGVDKEYSVSKPDEKALEWKDCPAESHKGSSDFTVVTSQPSLHEEEDLGWDEIEDMSSIDEKKVTQGVSPNRGELQKRLSTAVEEEEDLSWDIEDDDEPING